MKNRKIFMLLFVLGIMSLFIGGTLAFFNYSKISGANEIVSGQVYFDFTDESEGITLTNAFPMSATDARTRTDNTVSFSITGRDTYKKPIYYEIDLVNGEVPSGKTESNRILAKYLRFDLMEGENLVLDNVNFNDFNNKRIFVNTIEANTTSNITRNYTLRMWIDEDLYISDTGYDVKLTEYSTRHYSGDYTTEEFEKLFASIKVRVVGDFDVKRVINLKKVNNTYYDDFWSNSLKDVKENVTSVEFLRITNDGGVGTISESNYNTRYNTANLKEDVTYIGSPVTVWLELDDTNYKMYIASENVIVFPEDSSYMFYQFDKLESVKFYENVDTSSLKNAANMFANCGSLIELDLSTWDTHNVTNFSSIIHYCDNLKSVNMSGLDLSNTYLDYLFAHVPNLETIDLSNAIFGSKKSGCIFYYCKKLKNLNVTNMDVSRVTYMWGWFEFCESLEELDLSTWDTSNVNDMYSMFMNCSSLKRLNLSGWDMSKVTSSNNLYLPTSLEYLDMSDTILMPNCSYLFRLNGSSLTETELIIDLTNVDTSNVTDMSYMFYDCRKVKNLDLSSFDTSKVTTFYDMFYSCKGLTSLDLSSFDVSNVTTFSDMLGSCDNLKTLNISGWNLANYQGSNINFNYPQYLESIDASNVIFPVNCADFFRVYYSTNSIKTINLNNADTSHIENAYEMFYNLTQLTNLDLSSFNTSKMVNMYSMFYGCSSLTNLDLSSFDTSNVTVMYNMFYNCSSLVTIKVSNNWTTSGIGTSMPIFSGCVALVGGNGTTFDSNHINTDYAHVDESGNPGYLTLKTS